MADSKADLEKEIHGLKIKLGKTEAKVAELEAQLATASSSAPTDDAPVFGARAIPLEQR